MRWSCQSSRSWPEPGTLSPSLRWPGQWITASEMRTRNASKKQKTQATNSNSISTRGPPGFDSSTHDHFKGVQQQPTQKPMGLKLKPNKTKPTQLQTGNSQVVGILSGLTILSNDNFLVPIEWLFFHAIHWLLYGPFSCQLFLIGSW